MPIILKVGIDPVHFGVVMTLNLMIGLLHPPLGMVLFVLSRIVETVDRADHHGDPAVADSAVDVADRDYANSGIDAVAAADHGNVEVASAYFFSIGVTSAAVGIDGAAPIRCTQIDAAELA